VPFKAPRICGCGRAIPWNVICACQKLRDRDRKARHDANRPTARQRGYDGTWDRERTVYLAANPNCRRCSDPANVVDHIQPHKGNRTLFWNRSNWQPLCTPCHSRTKQAAERREAAQ
jgi:5-methylcytosine-specific restriction enzyme A